VLPSERSKEKKGQDNKRQLDEGEEGEQAPSVYSAPTTVGECSSKKKKKSGVTDSLVPPKAAIKVSNFDWSLMRFAVIRTTAIAREQRGVERGTSKTKARTTVGTEYLSAVQGHTFVRPAGAH
jgi:hypothetical protein